MIVDTSAVLAIVDDEPERAEFEQIIASAEHTRMAAPSYLEASIVLLRRHGAQSLEAFDLWMETIGIEVVAFTAEQARLARHAYALFGKDTHAAKLNFGDCVSYALAMDLDEPLLYKGSDFTHTDIRSGTEVF